MKLSDFLAPNQYKEDEEDAPKPTLSQMADTQFAPDSSASSNSTLFNKLKDYLSSQQQKDTDMHNDAFAAGRDRVNMQLHPELQGPTLDDANTPAELAQTKALLAPVMGTTSKFTAPEMSEEELFKAAADKAGPTLQEEALNLSKNNRQLSAQDLADANKLSKWQRIKQMFNK